MGFKRWLAYRPTINADFVKQLLKAQVILSQLVLSLLADGHYTTRHNRACKYLHWTICKEYDIDLKKVPGSPTVEETQLHTIKGTITIVKSDLSHTEL